MYDVEYKNRFVVILRPKIYSIFAFDTAASFMICRVTLRVLEVFYCYLKVCHFSIKRGPLYFQHIAFEQENRLRFTCPVCVNNLFKTGRLWTLTFRELLWKGARRRRSISCPCFWKPLNPRGLISLFSGNLAPVVFTKHQQTSGCTWHLSWKPNLFN